MRSLRCVLATGGRTNTLAVHRARSHSDKDMSEMIVVSRGEGRVAGDAVLGGQGLVEVLRPDSSGARAAVSVWLCRSGRPDWSLGQQPEHEAFVGAAHLVGHGAWQSHVLQATEDVQRIENMMKGISKARHDLTSAGNKASGKNAFARNAFLPQSATPRTGVILTGDRSGTQVKR